MATKAVGAQPPADSGGLDVGKWVDRAVKLALILGLAYAVLSLGVPATVAILDPGGTGGLLERLPRIVWHLGAIVFFCGLLVAIFWRKHGHGLIGYGLLSFAGGLGGPRAMAWLAAHGPDMVTATFDGVYQLLRGGIKLQ